MALVCSALVRFGPDQADQAAPVANAFPFRMASCSKYLPGISFATGR